MYHQVQGATVEIEITPPSSIVVTSYFLSYTVTSQRSARIQDYLSSPRTTQTYMIEQGMMSEPLSKSSMMDDNAKAKAEAEAEAEAQKRSNSLPTHVVDYLKAWIMSPEHINHPYPTETEKNKIISDTGIELKRLNNWFVNNRIRYWKPRVEAIQRQQQREGVGQIIPMSDTLSERSGPVKVEENYSTVIGLMQTPLQTSGNNHFESSPPVFLQRFTVSPSSSPSPTSTVSESSSSGSVSGSSSYDGDANDDSSALEVTDKQATIAKAVLMLNEQITKTSTSRKRKTYEVSPQTPRTMYRRKNIGLWRDVCKDSPRLYHEDLPSFDEAALLFGYTSDHKICTN